MSELAKIKYNPIPPEPAKEETGFPFVLAADSPDTASGYTQTYWDASKLRYLYGEIERPKKVFADAATNTGRDITDARLFKEKGGRIDQSKFENWVLDDFREVVTAREQVIQYYYQLGHLRPGNTVDPATQSELEVLRKRALKAAGDYLNFQKGIFSGRAGFGRRVSRLCFPVSRETTRDIFTKYR